MLPTYLLIENAYLVSLAEDIDCLIEATEVDQAWTTLNDVLIKIEGRKTHTSHQLRSQEEHQQWLENINYLREFVNPLSLSKEYHYQTSKRKRQEWLCAWSYSPEGYQWFQDIWTKTVEKPMSWSTELDNVWKAFEYESDLERITNPPMINSMHFVPHINMLDLLGLQRLEERIKLLHKVAFHLQTDSKVRCLLLDQMQKKEDIASIPESSFNNTFSLIHEEKIDQPALRRWLDYTILCQEPSFKNQSFVRQYEHEKDPELFWAMCHENGEDELLRWLPTNDNHLTKWMDELVSRIGHTSDHSTFWNSYKERLKSDKLSVGFAKKRAPFSWLSWEDVTLKAPDSISSFLQSHILKNKNLRQEWWILHLTQYGLQSIQTPEAKDLLRQDIQNREVMLALFNVLEQENPQAPWSITNLLREWYPSCNPPAMLSPEDQHMHTIIALVEKLFSVTPKEQESLVQAINTYSAVGINSPSQAIVQWLDNRQFKLEDTTELDWMLGMGSPR
jgi:hypothetical protein